MPRTMLLVAALAVAVLVAGCGRTGTDPAAATGGASSARVGESPSDTDDGGSGDAPENSADADPITAIQARWGPIRRSDAIDISTAEGYKARVTFEWHEETPVTHPLAVAPGCAAGSRAIAGLGGTGDTQYSVQAVSVLVSVDHLRSNGFEWKPDQSYSVKYDDGVTTQYFDRAHSCDTRNNGERLPGTLRFAPGDDPQIVQFIRSSEKTPNDPDGSEDGANPQRYRVIAPGCDDGGCITSYRQR